MDYTTGVVGQVVGAATGVGVVAAVLPNTSDSGQTIMALIVAAAGGALIVSSLISTIYKRTSR
jgi:ABC-type cobalamin transport system permease subunit